MGGMLRVVDGDQTGWRSTRRRASADFTISNNNNNKPFTPFHVTVFVQTLAKSGNELCKWLRRLAV